MYTAGRFYWFMLCPWSCVLLWLQRCAFRSFWIILQVSRLKVAKFWSQRCIQLVLWCCLLFGGVLFCERRYQSLSENIRAYLSLSEPIWAYQSLSEHIRAYKRLSEPIRAYLSLSEPVWAFQSIPESIRVCLSLSEPIRAYQSLSEPIRAYLRLSEPIRAYLSLVATVKQYAAEQQAAPQNQLNTSLWPELGNFQPWYLKDYPKATKLTTL